jgi:FtsZ-binding cell division protein ZapB
MSLTKKDLEELVKSLRGNIAEINKKLDEMKDENRELKKLVVDRDNEILSLRTQLNALEQHHRSWSIRVMNLPLSPDEEKSTKLIKAKLFNDVLLPIFEGAVAAGDLSEVPASADSVIELAHTLRAKEGAIKPLIARFRDREVRTLVFRHKKAFAPKHNTGPLKDRYRYLIFEDLTGLSFRKMREVAADERVAACWSANGQLRYRLVDDPAVRKIANPLDSVEKILG